jgi:hypothetical protein
MTMKLRFCRLAALAFTLLAPAIAPAFYLTPFVTSSGVEEWTHDATGRFRIVEEGAESEAYAAGLVEAGWRRTGHIFGVAKMFLGPWGQLPELHSTCRFFNPTAGTHFFTANAAECEALKTGAFGWQYEGLSFKVELPRDGACGYPPLGSSPIYRLYNNRRNGLPNHRYVGDAKLKASVLAEGWTDEGVAFCVLGSGRQTEAFYDAKAPARIGGPCTGTGCIVVRNLKALAHSLPIAPVQWGQPYPLLNVLTGWEQLPTRLFAAAASNDPEVLTRSTYVQAIDREAGTHAGFGPLGLHITSGDRIGDGVASIALRRELDLAAGERAVLWEGTRDSVLQVWMNVAFGALETHNGKGHAYGFPAIEFRDQVTGRGILVTLQAFGTQAPGDFAGFDAGRDIVLVSLELKPGAQLGISSATRYLRCSAGECDRGPYQYEFAFSMGRDDFEAMLARARMVEPQLSSDLGRYRVSAFECRAEIAGEAELGATIRRCQIAHSY